MSQRTAWLLGIAGILLIGAAAFFLSGGEKGGEDEGVFCTMEAKFCPDGSYVGRVPPSCEFALCPTSTSTATSTNGGGTGILPYGSGVEGRVMLGPTCPVMRDPPDPECNDKPYATLVTVFRASDPVHAIAIVQSDARGIFKVSLPPGTYTLGAGEAMLPRCDHASAAVPPEGYAQVTISCDTGIR